MSDAKKDLLLTILAMDAYNQGYNSGIQHGKSTIGIAEFVGDKGDQEAQDAGFYAAAYRIGEGEDTETVISYRGTDDFGELFATDIPLVAI